jgi:hypothetical protein
MRKICLEFLAILIVVFMVSLAALSCHNPIIPSSPVNSDLINYRSFFLSAENIGLDTFTRGTIFVIGDIEKEGERRVQISAWLEIDSTDWGGVGFYIPQGWDITQITSDYPQENPEPETYITTLHTEADRPFDTGVHVGATKYGAPELQGGKGNLIIELAPESSEQELPENFQTLIGVGSEYDYVMNPIHETFEVPLNIDYRTVRDP